MISRRRMSDCPALEIGPRRSLPPDDICLGTRPSQAAKSRPHLNVAIAGAKASTASAVIGPTLAARQRMRACARGGHCLQPAHSRGQRRLCRDLTGLGLNDFDDAFEMHRSLRHRMAIFVEHCALGICQLGALTHQPFARPKEHRPRLLLFALRRHKPHFGALRRDDDRFGISGIVFLAFNKGLPCCAIRIRWKMALSRARTTFPNHPSRRCRCLAISGSSDRTG